MFDHLKKHFLIPDDFFLLKLCTRKLQSVINKSSALRSVGIGFKKWKLGQLTDWVNSMIRKKIKQGFKYFYFLQISKNLTVKKQVLSA